MSERGKERERERERERRRKRERERERERERDLTFIPEESTWKKRTRRYSSIKTREKVVNRFFSL